MNKLLLWICIGVGGTVGSLLPLIWGSQDLTVAIILSTIGSIVGILVWYRLFRYL
jgi:hypothetical protein